MSLVKSLKIGNNSYGIKDEKAAKTLTASERTALLSTGLYRGEAVETGTKFLNADGAIEEFTKTVSGIAKGSTATQIGTLPQTPDDFHICVAQHGNDILVSNTGGTAYSEYYLSHDKGRTWTTKSLPSSGPNMFSYFYDGHFYITSTSIIDWYNYSMKTYELDAVGENPVLKSTKTVHEVNATHVLGDTLIWGLNYSKDGGETWTAMDLPSVYDYRIRSYVINNEFYVIGNSSASGQAWLFKTTDGEHLTRYDTVPSDVRYFDKFFKINDTYYAAYIYSDYGDQLKYITSTDLQTWTTAPAMTDVYWALYNSNTRIYAYPGLTFTTGVEEGYYASAYFTDLTTAHIDHNKIGYTLIDNEIICFDAGLSTHNVYKYDVTTAYTYSLTPLTYSKAQVDTALASKASTDTFTTTTAGLVPAPTASSTGKFLRGDGIWASAGGGGGGTEYVAGTNIVFEDASVGKYVLTNATEDLVNHTITLNGTYSGATIPSLSDTNINTLETFKFQVKCKLAGTTNAGRILQAFGTTTIINKNGVCYIGNTNVGSINLTDSNTYYFSLDKDDENLVTIKYSSDGDTWTTVGSKTLTSGVGVWALAGPDVYATESGMIFYMDECFVEFDGVKVWQGYDSSKVGVTRIDTAPSVAIDYAKDSSSVIIGKNQNPSTLMNAVVVGKNASASSAGVAIGINSKTSNGSVSVGANANGSQATGSTVVGYSAFATGAQGIALGREAQSKAENAVQIGAGINETANTLQFRGFPLVDDNGQVVHDRLSTVVKTFATTPSTGTADRADFLGQLGYSTSLQKLYWAKSVSSTSGRLLNMTNYNNVTISDDFIASGFLSGTSTHHLYKNFTSTSSITSSALYFKLTIPSTVKSTMYFASITTTNTTYNGYITSSGYISLGNSYTMAQNYKGHTVWFVYTGNNSASTSDLYALIDDNNMCPTIEDLPAFTSSAWTTLHVSYVLPLGSITQFRLGGSPSYSYSYNFAGSIDLKGVRLVRNGETAFDAAPLIYGTNWQEVGAGGGFDPTSITGYDATKVQTLKNNKGSLLWYDEDFLKAVDSLPAQGDPDTMYFVTGES